MFTTKFRKYQERIQQRFHIIISHFDGILRQDRQETFLSNSIETQDSDNIIGKINFLSITGSQPCSQNWEGECDVLGEYSFELSDHRLFSHLTTPPDRQNSFYI